MLCRLLCSGSPPASPRRRFGRRDSSPPTASRLPVANELVGDAVAACKEKTYNVTAVVLDIDGVRQAMLRGDGAGIATLEVANDKAFTSISTRTDTGVLVERAKTTPPSQFILKVPHMLLLQGGIVIKIGEETVGALGVSGAPGGKKDEACARAALDKISGQLK